MRVIRYDRWMLRKLLELKPRDVPVVVGLRNTAAVILPLAIGVATGHLGIGLGVAVGALNTMFSDQPGPYRLRVRRMLFAAGAAGISAFAGYTVGASTLATVVAAMLWGFTGGLLVARFIPVVRHFISTVAGIARMNLLAFVLMTTTGAER